MKKLITILLSLFLIFCVGGTVFAEKYKIAPEPHYNRDKGYGWKTNLAIDKPEHVWNILKIWEFPGKLMAFVDKNKDGKCDTMISFKKTGKYTDNGEPYVIGRPDEQTCQAGENEIFEFLKKQGELL